MSGWMDIQCRRDLDRTVPMSAPLLTVIAQRVEVLGVTLHSSE